MIDKVIIAEDQESANLSVQKTMEEMGIGDIDKVFYCDDAFKKIQIAEHKGQPYDLLITDLHFEADGTPQEIAGGIELVAKIREAYPALMILVFSAEQRALTLEKLFTTYRIDGYVRKARNDAKELKAALETLSSGQRYYPRSLAQFLKKTVTFPFTDFDLCIIRLLSRGYQQNQIPDYLRQNNIRPSSLSSIEKRLNLIRQEHNFSNNEQLVLYCKEKEVL